MGPGLTRNFFSGNFGVVYHVYSVLLKVVSYYDLSVLSMSVMGPKNVGGFCELYQFFFLVFFKFAKPVNSACSISMKVRVRTRVSHYRHTSAGYAIFSCLRDNRMKRSCHVHLPKGTGQRT